MRAGFQEINYTSASTIGLLLDHIYAPPILMSYKKIELFNINKCLNLIGFSVLKDTVELYYSNLDERFSYIEGSFKNIKKDFYDFWIVDSGFDLNNSISSEITGFETITFIFDKEDLIKLHNVNCKKIKRILKKTNKLAIT